MVCKKCGYKNNSDAILCEGCGANLVLEYYDDFEEGKTVEPENIKEQDNLNNDNKPTKNVTKNKTVNKTKNKTINKTKNPKEKKTKDKDKNKKSDNKQEVIVVKQGAGIGTRIFIILLITIILGLSMILSLVGYKYYQKNYNIMVPDLVGLTYEEAEITLAKKDLNIEKREVTTEDEKEDNVVLKQSTSAGSKAKKGSSITVSVGVLDDTYTVPNFIGMNIEEAIKDLTENGINYNVVYDLSDKDDNTIIKQSIVKGSKIDKNKTLTLTVSKKTEEEKTSIPVEEEE